MKHRDYIVFRKLIDEVKMARSLVGDLSLNEFVSRCEASASPAGLIAIAEAHLRHRSFLSQEEPSLRERLSYCSKEYR